jgi:hypothetical protein
MSMFATLAEQKILEAIRRGEFDDLPLKGQPLPKEEFGDVPEELRLGFKILKNAGFLPEVLQLNREILTLKDLLAGCQQEQERRVLKKRLTEKMLHYSILMEKKAHKPAFHRYADRLRTRFGL